MQPASEVLYYWVVNEGCWMFSVPKTVMNIPQVVTQPPSSWISMDLLRLLPVEMLLSLTQLPCNMHG